MMNLIMGAAKGYGWDTLEPFVTSCKRNCPDAELVLFVDDMSDFTRDKLIQAGVTLEYFPDELRGIPNNTRWKIFGDWLETHGAEYEQVFITDTRDVIFQGDIFAKFHGLTNWLGYATEGDDIRGNRTGDDTNYLWLTAIFPRAEIDAFCDRKIICDGTVIGSSDAMKIFCRELYKLVAQVEARTLFRIHDQAIANYLIRTNRLPVKNLIELGVDGGEIFTAGLAGEFSIRDGLIVYGEIPAAVVHQCDRYENSAQLIDKIYRDQNFQADPHFDDLRSVFEQTACLLTVDAVEAAAKLFVGKLLVAEDLSGCVGTLLRLWENALRKPLDEEIIEIELAAQAVLKINEEFSSGELEKICRYLRFAHDGHHPIDAEFANSVARSLLHAAQQTLAAGEIERHRFCMDLLEILGVESEATR